MVEPVRVQLEREPHRWGAGGPGIPAHGNVLPSEKAKEDVEKELLGATASQFKLGYSHKSETDEGDYDQYSDHSLSYKGDVVWKFSTSSHSNIGGSWGTDSTCTISGDTLRVELSHRGKTVGGGYDTNELREYSLKDILIASAVAAGAKPPIV
mmetsp:Transcript_45176/g.92215  ORF Transcript_45176/g.92215 Transcript_45176/m.92215 type:complete len:153 (+) Transcript_45176:118-576(+)|eukprot:CAMPEP_0181313680 /NCGR_PEP_ID=MMETSP1101-20121128/14381_1 /TAXON_ID=46948 /ORGANISM="Rhodomonas abbreviata, Strain Caron Lab Isolate" /LENGTH=152 /DNA_ID=CAMNT_0023420657 /DNA_START=107 /DNA_END=565 /DNA_ORIENTATION=-